MLFPHSTSYRMNVAMLEYYISEYIWSQPKDNHEVHFIWQGGEPTILGIDFFKKVIEFQQKYARSGMDIRNSIQTNGVLLNHEWGKFLHEQNFLVGISIDGPQHFYDYYRRGKNGLSLYKNVIRGIEFLKQHAVEFNTLTCLNSLNSYYPKEIYDFLKKIGTTFMQFIPVVVKDSFGNVVSCSVNSLQYGKFLNGVLSRWLELGDIGKIFVQDFDNLLGLLMGFQSSLCTHAVTCGNAIVIEHNGDVFSCDHYVNRENYLGNLQDNPLFKFVDSFQQIKFGEGKKRTLPLKCLQCKYLNLCNGGCPKDRFVDSGCEYKLNYLCEGYMNFFKHSIPLFKKMAKCLSLGRPASEYDVIDDKFDTIVN